MRRESVLAAGAVGVILLATVAAVLVPGALADPGDRPVRPGPVDISGIEISAGEVTGGTVSLHVDTRLSHRGPPTRNVTLRVQAVDTASGLVETTREVTVGEITDEREVSVPTTLTVEREGGYRIRAVVYRDGQRVDAGARELSGLEALQPSYARSDVRFADQTALPPVSYSVASTSGDTDGPKRATLALQVALTNEGDDQPEDLRVTLTLRQADSNVVANQTAVSVGSIRPGRTQTVDARLTVPAAYNYYVDAVLWRDGVVIDTARGAANLDPSETISVNETRREVELRLGDFTDDEGERPRPEATGTPVEGGGPGFGVVVAVVAVVAAAALARRKSQ